MLELRSTNDIVTGTSPVVSSHSPIGAAHGAQLSTVYEADPHKSSHDPRAHRTSHISGFATKPHRTRSERSCDASPSSTIEGVYDEKVAEQIPRRSEPKLPKAELRKQQNRSNDPTPSRDGTDRDPMADDRPGRTTPKKAKGHGLKIMIRRLFSKKSVKNRISMPAPVIDPHNVSSSTCMLPSSS